MGTKRIVAGIMLIGVLGISSGCSYLYNRENKKIVLEEDVRKSLAKESMVQVKVEQLDFKLAQGSFFTPVFYYNGEIYGSIGKESGMIKSEDLKDFPVGARLKPYLYRLENNILKETTKRVFTYPYDSKLIAHDRNSASDTRNGKILSIDYLKEDQPKVLSKLSETLGTIGRYDNVHITEHRIEGDKTILSIINNVAYQGYALYFYDVEKNKLYTRDRNILNEEQVEYIPALRSFIRIDENYKCYKVVFEKNTFHFEEYIDLNRYVKRGEGKRKIRVIPINEEEVLLIENAHLKEEGYFKYHPIQETKTISKFNFTTNQYEELFVAQEHQHFFANYIGEVTAIGAPTFIIDTFEHKEGVITPKERTFQKIEESQLITVYKEDIESEGTTLSPWVRTVRSQDGKEIFLEKERTVMEDDVETTKEAIYKRYSFE